MTEREITTPNEGAEEAFTQWWKENQADFLIKEHPEKEYELISVATANMVIEITAKNGFMAGLHLKPKMSVEEFVKTLPFSEQLKYSPSQPFIERFKMWFDYGKQCAGIGCQTEGVKPVPEMDRKKLIEWIEYKPFKSEPPEKREFYFVKTKDGKIHIAEWKYEHGQGEIQWNWGINGWRNVELYAPINLPEPPKQ